MTNESAAAENLGRLLREQRTRHNWKQEVLARKAQLDPSYISKLERGATGNVPPKETLEKLAYAYQLPVEDLLKATEGARVIPSTAPRPYTDILEEARMAGPVAIPVYEHPVHAGHSGVPVLDYIYAEPTFAVNRDLLCVPVRGHCMTPRIEEGDRVIVDRGQWPEPGEVVLAVVDEEVYVRRFYRTDSQLVLRADNPEYPEIETREGDIVGVVVEVRKRP